MDNWGKFWAGLNIRKTITLIFGLGFIIASVAIVIAGLVGADKELVNSGLGQLGTLTCMCVSYYMGYSNQSKPEIQGKGGDQL